jgi:hypothetical protein
MKALEVGPFMLGWLAAVGCGSGSSAAPSSEASGFLGGSVGGVTFVARESAASRATTAYADVLEVLFSDATGLCTGSRQNASGLSLLIDVAGSSPQIAAGSARFVPIASPIELDRAGRGHWRGAPPQSAACDSLLDRR